MTLKVNQSISAEGAAPLLIEFSAKANSWWIFFLPSFQQVWAGISHILVLARNLQQFFTSGWWLGVQNNQENCPFQKQRAITSHFWAKGCCWNDLYCSTHDELTILHKNMPRTFLTNTARSSVKPSSDFLKITLQKAYEARIWWTQLSVENEFVPTKPEKTNAHTGTNLILVAFVFFVSFCILPLCRVISIYTCSRIISNLSWPNIAW